MSLILEALRKSEAERRRGERPTLHGELPPVAPSSRAPLVRQAPWLLAAGVTIAAGWGIYTWLMHRPDGQPPTTPMRATAPPAQRAAAAASDLPPVKHLTPPVAVAKPSLQEAAPRLPSPSRPISPAPSDAVVEEAVRLPAPTPAPASAAVPGASPESPLHLSDLGAEERKALPPLKLSMHMWNEAPAQRFVILDGNRLREGDRIGDAVVTTITRDGVLLDWNGRPIEVPIR